MLSDEILDVRTVTSLNLTRKYSRTDRRITLIHLSTLYTLIVKNTVINDAKFTINCDCKETGFEAVILSLPYVIGGVCVDLRL